MSALTRSPAKEPGGLERPAGGITDIGGECRLAVGPGFDEAVGATVAEGDGGHESGGLLGALVLERQRRHGHGDVVGEQSDERVDVTDLIEVGEAVHELALLR